MAYAFGFFWGFVLLAIFAGWGRALERALKAFPNGGPPDWGLAIVLGMALIIALAGPLNLLGGMTSIVVWLLLVCGFVEFAVEIRRVSSRLGTGRPLSGPTTSLHMVTVLACVVAYASSVCLSESPYGDPTLRQRFTLNPWDDLNGGYITGPLRLLSEGRLGDDPFNNPRSLSLGGQPVLQAFALLILPPTYIHLLDPGLAILTLPLVLQGLGRSGGWPSWLASLLTLLCLVLKTPWVNASAQLLPTVFLLALYGVLDRLARQSRAGPAELFVVALLASAVITLKNVLVPGTCLILGIFLILDYVARREFRRTVTSGLATCLMMGLLLSPWLVSSYRASGTPLYPLLGEGYWADSMANVPSLTSGRDAAAEARQLLSVLKDPRIVLLILLGTAGLAVATRHRLRQRSGVAYLAVLLTAIPVVVIYAHVFQTDWLRFGYNFAVLAILASFAVLLGSEEGRTWLDNRMSAGTRAVAALMMLCILAGFAYQAVFVRPTVTMISKAIRATAWDPDEERERYRRLQSAIPPGQPFLSFLPMAHLLDFHRNPIYVAHLNCGISPPPGMPLRGTAENVAQYLRSRGIMLLAARDTFWTPGGESRDPEPIRRWSEACRDQWDSGVVYSYYAMARCIRSLVVMYAAERFEGDLVLINLERPFSRGNPTSEPRSTGAGGGDAHAGSETRKARP